MAASIAALLLTSISSVFAQSKKRTETIVLVHGAWSDASAWDHIVPQLKSAGFEVIAVNLPGHGKDNTPPAGITLDNYVAVVKKAIGTKNNVILVGHSMGGAIIGEVAEQIPTQIKKLIYLAAFLPHNGEAMISIAQTDTESHLVKYLQVNKEEGSASVAKDGFIDAFAADAPDAVKEQLLNTLKPEPLAPVVTPVVLSDANYGKVEKVFIYTVNDHAISYAVQQKMVAEANIGRTYALPSSHAAFLAMPGVLAAIIEQEAK